MFVSVRGRAYAAILVAHAPIRRDVDKVRVSNVDGRMEVLILCVRACLLGGRYEKCSYLMNYLGRVKGILGREVD